LDERQTLALFADQRIRIDLHIFKGDFRSAAAIDRRVVARRNAGSRLVHDEHRHAVAVALAARGASRHDELLCPGRAENNGLITVDDIARTVLLRRGGEVGEVVAALRLGIGEGPDRFAADNAGDMRFLLRGRAAFTQETARDDNSFEVRLDDEVAAELFHDDHGFDGTTAKTALLFGERSREKAKFRELRPDFRTPTFSRLRHL